MNGVHLVFFDCDGTLIDSQHTIHTAMSRMFQLQGLVPPSRDAVRLVVRLALDDTIAMIAPDLDAATIALVAQEYKASFFALCERSDHRDHEPLFDGMAEVDAMPKSTLVIGNTTFDIEMTNAAGVAGLGVTLGVSPCFGLGRPRRTAHCHQFRASGRSDRRRIGAVT